MKEKTINKILKLLKLSESSNENEAMLALQMAQKLALQHNISIDSVQDKEVSVEDTVYCTTNFLNLHTRMIGQRLAKHFRVDVYRSQRYDYFLKKSTFETRVIGYPEDVEIFKEIFNYCEAFFKARWAETWKQAQKKSVWDKKKLNYQRAQNTYLQGFVSGIDDALKKNEEQYALVIVKDHIVKYEEQMDLKRTSFRIKSEDNVGIYNEGYEDGKTSVSGTKQIGG